MKNMVWRAGENSSKLGINSAMIGRTSEQSFLSQIEESEILINVIKFCIDLDLSISLFFSRIRLKNSRSVDLTTAN